MALSNRERIGLIIALACIMALLAIGQVARGQTPLNLVPGVNTLGAGSFSWPSGKDIPIGAKISGVRGKTIILTTANSAGYGIAYRGDGLELRDVVIQGAALFMDKPGGRNTNITIDNVEWRVTSQNAIKFTSGLANSRITNCLFTGSSYAAVYGYNYRALVIANNEFIGCQTGMHIDAMGDSGDLLVEQNLVSGVTGMGMEFQGTASGNVFQDNWYEKATTIPNTNKMAYSLILSKSQNVVIRRNVALMPIKAQQPAGAGYTVIVFEVGGDNVLVEDNYSIGGNHVVAMNDGDGSSSVTVRNNRFVSFAQGISNSFPAGNRVLTQSNNGPNVVLSAAMQARLAANDKPGRNRRYGSVPTPPPTTIPVPPAPPVTLKPVITGPSAIRAGQSVTFSATDSTRIELDINDGLPEIKVWSSPLTVTLPTNSAGKNLRVRAFGPGGMSEKTIPISAAALTAAERAALVTERAQHVTRIQEIDTRLGGP